uniref:Uncharacterized protein n=1 Tax=Opuntia streptacantha TaxID=393608 RepID=A0A7C9EFJ6_OPUST
MFKYCVLFSTQPTFDLPWQLPLRITKPRWEASGTFQRKSSSTYSPAYRLSRSACAGAYGSHGELYFPDPNSSEPTSIGPEFSHKNHSFSRTVGVLRRLPP